MRCHIECQKQGCALRDGEAEGTKIRLGQEACELVAGSADRQGLARPVQGRRERADTDRAHEADRCDTRRRGKEKQEVEAGWSFADALESLLPELRAFARNLSKEPSLADDLVQDACLKAWSRIDQYDRNYPLRPWLFRILRNEFYQHKRKHWRDSGVDVEPLLNEMIVEDDQPHIFDAGRAIQALDVLSSEQRDAFILVVAAGFTYEEAGEICGCAAGTVKSRVSRARGTLQTLLQSRKLSSEIDAIAPSSFSALLDEIEAIKRRPPPDLAAA